MKEHISKIIKNPAALSAIVGSVTFAAGTGIGYILGSRRNNYEVFEPPARLGLVLDADDLKQIEENNHYSDSSDDDEEEEDEDDSSDEDLVTNETVSAKDFIAEKLRTPVVIAEEIQEEPQEAEPVLEEVNIFARDDEEWYQLEVPKRNPSVPYIIHRDEFFNEEMDFHQSTLTWYEGDNTLAAEDNTPVYNHHDVIGDMRFGYGSGDPNVFYVRNEKLRAEYEILRDDGRFQVKVLGYEIEDNAETEDSKRSNGLKKFSRTD